VICEYKEDPSLQPGQIASISIDVEDANNLYGFEIFLRYDPNILEFSECLPGVLVGNYTLMQDIKINDVETFKELWYVVTYDPIINGSGEILIVNFTVIGVGSTTLDITTNLIDPNLRWIESNDIDGFFSNEESQFVASFFVSPDQIKPGDEVTFDASPSYNLNASIIDYEWNLGDKTTLHGKIVTHIYEKAGSYKVILRITDDQGRVARASRYIVVKGEEKLPKGGGICIILSPLSKIGLIILLPFVILLMIYLKKRL
jgi:hypothetical protein